MLPAIPPCASESAEKAQLGNAAQASLNCRLDPGTLFSFAKLKAALKKHRYGGNNVIQIAMITALKKVQVEDF